MCVCTTRLSSTKLSNLLKSQSSSVSADETRPPLRNDDPVRKKSRFARSINNVDRQTSPSLDARKLVFRATIIFIDQMWTSSLRSWLIEVDTAPRLIFNVYALSPFILFFSFYRLSLQHACDALRII